MNRKRRDDETFEEYKENLKEENLKIRQILKGRMLWNSSNLIFENGFKIRSAQGTYKRSLHGELEV